MAQKIIPVRYVYRSYSMVPLLTIMENAGIWKDHGIDVRDYRFTSDPLDAEEQLLDGGIDFIFGNHVSPYMRLAHGEPMVCLAQTENWLHMWVVTAPAITALPMLQGKRMIGRPLFLGNGKFCGHGDGNRILLLELHGVDTKRVEFLDPERGADAIAAVRNGKAEGCFISPDRAERAATAGLRVHKLPPMPMVHSITFTTTAPRVLQEPDFAERITKVLVDATHFFKTRKEESLELLKNPIETRTYEGQQQRWVRDYDELAAEYETKPYPRPEAVLNVWKLACMVYPEAKAVNPMELWDTNTLRGIFGTGYVDNLYGGRESVEGHVHRTLDRWEHARHLSEHDDDD